MCLLWADPAKVVHTELSLMPEEFDRYQIGVNTDITFCLKELRVRRRLLTDEVFVFMDFSHHTVYLKKFSFYKNASLYDVICKLSGVIHYCGGKKNS